VRALVVLRYFPTLTETFVNEELRALCRQGHSVRVLRLGARSDGATLGAQVPPVELIDPPGGLRRAAAALRAPTAGQRFIAAHQRPKDALRYRATLEALRPSIHEIDVIHVHFAGEAAEWAHALALDTGLPWTCTAHAVDLYCPRPALPTTLRTAGAVLCVSAHGAGALGALGLHPTLLRCGPRLDDWAALDPGPVQAGPLRALFVGRDRPKKGLDLLLEAWAARPRGEDDQLHVITDRPTADQRPLPGLRWSPLMGPAALRAAVAASNVSVLPCRRAPDGDQDGVPLVLMEAMAAGRPVIAGAVAGVPELVDETVGWLIPPDDAAALAQALTAAADPAARAPRGAAGPARLCAGGFTLEDQVEGLLQAWRAVAGASAP
jgi:glycosyltransferase involved in cell wall biosynthesis